MTQVQALPRHGATEPASLAGLTLRRLSEDGSEGRSAVRLVRPFHGARREGAPRRNEV